MRVLLVGLGLCVFGCSPGVRWSLGTFEDARTQAAAKQRLLLVYFRNWYSVECTRFEEEVLKHPSILAATADLVCVPLEHSYSADASLARSWGLDGAPAVAIVDPTGSACEAISGPVSVQELLAAIRRAKERFAPQTQPVKSR